MSRGGEQIKVSEVAGLIDQIEVGGGGSEIDCPVTIDKVTWNDVQDVTNTKYIESSGSNNKIKFDITINESVGYSTYFYFFQDLDHVYSYSNKLTGKQSIEFTNIKAPYDSSNYLFFIWVSKPFIKILDKDFKMKCLWGSDVSEPMEG